MSINTKFNNEQSGEGILVVGRC